MKFKVVAHISPKCNFTVNLERALPTEMELRLEHSGKNYFYSHTEVTENETTYHFKSEVME